jgi:hypothetical protein
MKWFFAKTSKQVFNAEGDALTHYEGKAEYVEIDEEKGLELDALDPAQRSVDVPQGTEGVAGLETMTKAKLVAFAAEKTIVIDASATKAVILAAIKAALPAE